MVKSRFPFRRRGFKKVKVMPKKSYPQKAKQTFAKRVNAIISSNNENKFTATLKYNDAISRTNATSGYTFYCWSPAKDSVGSRLFNLYQDVTQQTRIGNAIKLKRWIIKGLIQPVVSNTTTMLNSYVGFVDIFFGKYLVNTAPVDSSLNSLYQNGNSALTPTCLSSDMLCPLNRDNYKVYYHRRFKMGAASDYSTYDADGHTGHPANNDFKLAQTFGFDVCKYILKNKHLKYPDLVGNTTVPPNDADIRNLTLWATWTPQTGQATGASSATLYNIDTITYAEYEDA